MCGKVQYDIAILVLALLIATASSSVARLIPTFSLSQVTTDADMIAIGQIQITANVPTTMVVENNSYEATDHFGNLLADRILKSSDVETAGHVPLHWVTPDSQFNWPIYSDVKDSTYMLFFLKKRPAEVAYDFVSSDYPGLPVLPRAPVKDAALEDQILDQVSGYLESNSGETEKKSLLVNQLGDVRNPGFTKTLYKLFNGSDPHLRMTALFALLTRKEAELIPTAEQEIVQNTSHALPWERQNLILALSQHFDASLSVPILTEALRSPEIEIRQTTAYALRSTRSKEAVRPLLSALDDTDSEVQWNVMHSLGELVNQLEWRPNSKEPAEWHRCLDHWHEFAVSWRPPASE